MTTRANNAVGSAKAADERVRHKSSILLCSSANKKATVLFLSEKKKEFNMAMRERRRAQVLVFPSLVYVVCFQFATFLFISSMKFQTHQ